MNQTDNDRKYRVVKNALGQYSIWAVDRTLPAGWFSTDFVDTKKACLAHIDQVWVDMTPLNLKTPLQK
jgi:MbtH protein